jgi:hypothetical protein
VCSLTLTDATAAGKRRREVNASFIVFDLDADILFMCSRFWDGFGVWIDFHYVIKKRRSVLAVDVG